MDEREQKFMKNLTEQIDRIDAHNERIEAHNERIKAKFKELLSRISFLRPFSTNSLSNPVTTSNEDPMRTTVIPPTATPTNINAREKYMTDFTEDTKHMKTTESDIETKSVPMVHKHDNDNYNNATEEEMIFCDKSKYLDNHDDEFSGDEFFDGEYEQAIEEAEDESYSYND